MRKIEKIVKRQKTESEEISEPIDSDAEWALHFDFQIKNSKKFLVEHNSLNFKTIYFKPFEAPKVNNDSANQDKMNIEETFETSKKRL